MSGSPLMPTKPHQTVIPPRFARESRKTAPTSPLPLVKPVHGRVQSLLRRHIEMPDSGAPIPVFEAHRCEADNLIVTLRHVPCVPQTLST